MDICHYISVPGIGRVFIPGCLSGAEFGMRRCVCNRQRTQKRQAEKIEELEARIAHLEQLIQKLTEQNA